jgi:hypothetical protein
VSARFHPAVQRGVRQLWRLVTQGAPVMDEPAYTALSVSLQRVLSPRLVDTHLTLRVPPPEHNDHDQNNSVSPGLTEIYNFEIGPLDCVVEQVARQDWRRDSGGASYLSFGTFARSVLDLTDLLVPVPEERGYIDFMEYVVGRVAADALGGTAVRPPPPRWRGTSSTWDHKLHDPPIATRPAMRHLLPSEAGIVDRQMVKEIRATLTATSIAKPAAAATAEPALPRRAVHSVARQESVHIPHATQMSVIVTRVPRVVETPEPEPETAADTNPEEPVATVDIGDGESKPRMDYELIRKELRTLNLQELTAEARAVGVAEIPLLRASRLDYEDAHSHTLALLCLQLSEMRAAAFPAIVAELNKLRISELFMRAAIEKLDAATYARIRQQDLRSQKAAMVDLLATHLLSERVPLRCTQGVRRPWRPFWRPC